MGAVVNDMCNASKEMNEIVKELLQQLRADQNGYTDRANRMFSVRELTVPLLYVVPLMASIFVGTLTLNSYVTNLSDDFKSSVSALTSEIKDIKRELNETKQEATLRSYDRVTRTDLVQICYNWQVKNNNINLECNAIYNIQHLNAIQQRNKK